jgi:hypothetical protein
MRDKLGRFKKGIIVWCKGLKKPPQISGKNSHKWKGGQYISSQGYVFVYTPNHPRPDHPDGYMKRARYVMEQHLGRYLKPKETVHHKGIRYPEHSLENKQDDLIDNLELFANRPEHMKHHKNRAH